MHTLFNLVPRARQGIQVPGLWPSVREGLRRNLGLVIRYARDHPMAVPGNHILVRLIQTVDIPLSLDLERYHAHVEAVALPRSMTMKMTSSIYRGELWDGDFYGPGHDEILLVHTEHFDFHKTHEDWLDATPVRVLRHPGSDLGLHVPDGHLCGTETGIAVIAINLPMLMVQYRAFRLEQVRASGGHDAQSTMMFIRRVVLPNMLFSHLDQALFNRIHKLAAHEQPGESIRRHRFALIDYGDKLDQCYREVLDNLGRLEKNFVGILQSVPAAARRNMELVMRVPDMAPTRQAMWALAVARLPMLDFVLSMTRDTPQRQNQADVNLILRNLLAWQQEHLFEGVMDPLVQQDVMQELAGIQRKANLQ